MMSFVILKVGIIQSIVFFFIINLSSSSADQFNSLISLGFITNTQIMMTLLLLGEYDIDFYLNLKSSTFLLSIFVLEERKKVADY